ncbi:hypothetical protein ACLB2K_022288 [Fragaria x ananassa]
MPKRAVASEDLKRKSVYIFESARIASKEELIVADEGLAISLTCDNNEKPSRRLTQFTLHSEDGTARPLEMVEAGMFITGTVLPLSENSEKSMESNIRCEAFGKIDAWKISGYNEGWPKIWLSAKVADYCCVEPAIGYKKQYDDLFFKKAVACIEVYQELSECKPGCRLGQLLAPVARSLSGN